VVELIQFYLNFVQLIEMKDFVNHFLNFLNNFEQILQVLIDYIEEMNHLAKQILTKNAFVDEFYHINQMEYLMNEY
jgi:hypothetical protein